MGKRLQIAAEGSTQEALPEEWAQAPLGNVLTLNYGKALREDHRNSGFVAVYGSNGIVGYHDSSLTHAPTIIVGRKGSVGEVHFSQNACWPIDTTYFIDAFSEFEPQFVFYQLKALKLSEQEKSSAIPGLNRDDVYERLFAIAPRSEQRRIVAKVEALLAQVTAHLRDLAWGP